MTLRFPFLIAASAFALFSFATTSALRAQVSITNGATREIFQDSDLGAPSAGLTMNEGTLEFGAALTVASTRAVTLQGPGGGVFDTNGFDATIASTISGSGNFTKNGLGTLTLTGADSGSGVLTVNAGTVQLGAGGALLNTLTINILANGALKFNGGTLNSVATIFDGGTLDLNGNNLISSNVSGSGAVTLGGGRLTIIGGGLESGLISGTGGSLVVATVPTGGLELDGANTYTGGTTLTSGTLIAGNASAFGTGLLQVNGGTLKVGNGNHAITTLSYAQTAGTLYLNLAGHGNAAVEETLFIANTLQGSQASLGGNLTINLAHFTAAPVPVGTTKTYTFAVVETEAGFTGTFASFDALNLGRGLTANLDYSAISDDVVLQIIQSNSFFSLAGLTSNQQAILASINRGLEIGSAAPSFKTLVDSLSPLTNNPATLGAALDQLSPLQFGQFTSTTAFNNASFETEAQDNYLAGQRNGPNGTFTSGNGTIDASGLTLNDPSYDPTLAMVHSRMLAWNPGPLSVSDIASPVLGGVDMKDTKSMISPAETNPWNVFVRGNVILAQGFSQPDISHFDDNTESVTVGSDYRITPNFLVGLAAGYAHTDATLDNNGSSATVDSYSPGFYASYADEGWYANVLGNYIHNAYTQSRVIGFLGQTADGAPEGNEGVANLDGGYDFHHGAFTFGPLAGLQYTHLTVDGYHETGSIADLSVDDQNADSLRSRLGGRINYAFAHCGINFTPHLDASWQHEFLDQSRGITSQFNGGLGSFNVRTTNPSRDSALADAGLDAEINSTLTVFGDYEVQAGQENYFGQSVQAGVKIGF